MQDKKIDRYWKALGILHDDDDNNTHTHRHTHKHKHVNIECNEHVLGLNMPIKSKNI